MQMDQLLVVVLWTCFCALLDVTPLGAVVPDDKQPDSLFPNTTLIFKAKLTCENTVPSGGTYTTETWSCYNLKINGNRLRYAYLGGFGTETEDTEGVKNKRKNDFGGLCQHLLSLHGINKKLWSAFVDDISTKITTGPRMVFVSTRGSHEWQEDEAGKGYVKTLRCMTLA